MNLKQYQNELIVFFSFLLMLAAFFYKNGQVSSQLEQMVLTKQTVNEIKEVIALKKVWGDKKTSKKVDKLKELITASKVKWSKKSKKVTVSYKGLSSKELNKLITKILNLAVIINELNIKKTASSYDVEFKCKW